MWEYNEINKYYYCLLGSHRLVVQPLETHYCVYFYITKKQIVSIKTFIHADTIEEAQNFAMRIVMNHAIENMCFWNNIIEMTKNNLME